MQIKLTKALILNSAFATTKKNQSYNSNLLFQIPPTTFSPSALARYCTLHSAQIPVSFYNVTNENNVFVYNGTSYTLTPKNYNAPQIITALSAAINDNNVSITVDRQTNKFRFEHNQPFTFGGTNATLNRLLGFVNGTTYNSSTGAHPHYLDSPNCANLAGPSRIHIYTNFQTENFDSDGGNSSILTTIPVNAVPGAFIYYSEVVDTDMVLKNSNLGYVEIQLTDEFGTLLDFNGVEVTLHLQIDEIHEVAVTKTLEQLLNLSEKNVSQA
jgi:hypothetical protein